VRAASDDVSVEHACITVTTSLVSFVGSFPSRGSPLGASIHPLIPKRRGQGSGAIREKTSSCTLFVGSKIEPYENIFESFSEIGAGRKIFQKAPFPQTVMKVVYLLPSAERVSRNTSRAVGLSGWQKW
jgi:hypothetical protein